MNTNRQCSFSNRQYKKTKRQCSYIDRQSSYTNRPSMKTNRQCSYIDTQSSYTNRQSSYTNRQSMNTNRQCCYCYDIKPVRKEEGKSYWKIPLCDDDATREK